jgi:hypothetical protein
MKSSSSSAARVVLAAFYFFSASAISIVAPIFLEAATSLAVFLF